MMLLNGTGTDDAGPGGLNDAIADNYSRTLKHFVARHDWQYPTSFNNQINLFFCLFSHKFHA
jgi:hypothetical protein